MKQQMINVAVVGAGAAGLCALRHLTSRCRSQSSSVLFKATAFEQNTRVGGTWLYTDNVGTDELGLPVHSSMYKNLKTNLPKECMGFPDFAFPAHLPSFLTHEDVQNYLEDYATQFDLYKNIKLHTLVKHIKPLADEQAKFGVQWEVTTADVTVQKETWKDLFDAVLICNGHYATPLYPQIPGLDSFEGLMMHSHSYREPSAYANQTVVVLGAGSSGQDIVVEVSSVAKQAYLSHNRDRLITYLPPNVEQKPGIKHCHKNVLEFCDGSALQVDSLILCTGYHYDFSFLDPKVGLSVEQERVTPLFQHFVHCQYPTLGLVGIPKTVIPMPLFDVQIRFFRAVLEGKCILPSEEEMLQEEAEQFDGFLKEGFPARYCHVLADRQFDYNDKLAAMANIDSVPKTVCKIYKACQALRRANIVTYRQTQFVLTDKDEFKVLDEGGSGSSE